MKAVEASRSHHHRSLLGRTLGADAWRRAAATLALLPVSLATGVAVLTGGGRWAALTQAGLVRRINGRRGVEVPTVGATFTPSLLGIPLGALAWVGALLAGPNTIRNVMLYGLVGDGFEHSWGGPTLAGAWATHAALVLALVPLELGVIRAIGALHGRILASDRPRWVMPTALLVSAVGIVFMVALVRQL